LVVGKHHFILIIGPHAISTYFRPNIHQNSPEILGVKECNMMFFDQNRRKENNHPTSARPRIIDPSFVLLEDG
jgi:hypothetical protein